MGRLINGSLGEKPNHSTMGSTIIALFYIKRTFSNLRVPHYRQALSLKTRWYQIFVLVCVQRKWSYNCWFEDGWHNVLQWKQALPRLPVALLFRWFMENVPLWTHRTWPTCIWSRHPLEDHHKEYYKEGIARSAVCREVPGTTLKKLFEAKYKFSKASDIN